MDDTVRNMTVREGTVDNEDSDYAHRHRLLESSMAG